MKIETLDLSRTGGNDGCASHRARFIYQLVPLADRDKPIVHSGWTPRPSARLKNGIVSCANDEVRIWLSPSLHMCGVPAACIARL